MLNIYYGREDIDKQRFLFSCIAEENKARKNDARIFLITPDQFKLEMERAAFDYLESSILINPVVTSVNRLAAQVLSETGAKSDYINLYGKYMLLAKLLRAEKDKLEVYKKFENSPAFIEKLSSAIMSFKTHMLSPDALEKSIEKLPSSGLKFLRKKLKDLQVLYAAYENALENDVKLPDSTDITRRFAAKIGESRLLKGASVWVYGYDYISPLFMEVFAKMSVVCENINVVLTAEIGTPFFSLTNKTAEKLREAAQSEGVEAGVFSVQDEAKRRGISYEYREKDKSPAEIEHIEKALFFEPLQTFANDLSKPSAVRLVKARTFEDEAEATADEILRLVRKEGLRYRDILVLCNDQGARVSALKRVFDAYNIPSFFDRRRDVDHNPILEYILSLCEIVIHERRGKDIFRWLRTGLTGIDDADAQQLENYAIRYGLCKDAWGKTFVKGKAEYSAEVFGGINAAANKIAEILDVFEEKFGIGDKSAKERTLGLREFLREDVGLENYVEAFAAKLEEDGFEEYAAEMRGILEVTDSLLVQIEKGFGSLELSADEYTLCLRVGVASVKMGMLPPSSDRVVVGTMQRTRAASVKALFVLGANDGLLPRYGNTDDLLGSEEKATLETLGIEAFRNEDNLFEEERLAIYKNLSRPTRLLWVSYTTSGGENSNNSSAPSQIFERLRTLFASNIAVEEAESETLETIRASSGLNSDEQEKFYIKQGLLKSLIAKNENTPLDISVTSLERYSRCPLAWFLKDAVHLSEKRAYQVDGRSFGSVFHDTLMRFGQEMEAVDIPSNAPESKWQTVNKKETDALIEKVFAEAIRDFDEGIFHETEKAKYQSARMKKLLQDVAWVLTERVKGSKTQDILFEEKFSDVNIGKLKLHGRVDRMETTTDGGAKIVDYKSGGDEFNLNEIESGWSLQLMLYLEEAAKKYRPLGVSYFPVKEQRIDISDVKKAPINDEQLLAEIVKAYQADGFFVGAEENALPGEKVYSQGEFEDLRERFHEQLESIAFDFMDGNIQARPKKNEKVTACTHCHYKGVCGRDKI